MHLETFTKNISYTSATFYLYLFNKQLSQKAFYIHDGIHQICRHHCIVIFDVNSFFKNHIILKVALIHYIPILS